MIWVATAIFTWIHREFVPNNDVVVSEMLDVCAFEVHGPLDMCQPLLET